MSLIIAYLVLIVTGTFISYGIGYAIEVASSPGVSLLVFLSTVFLLAGRILVHRGAVDGPESQAGLTGRQDRGEPQFGRGAVFRRAPR